MRPASATKNASDRHTGALWGYRFRQSLALLYGENETGAAEVLELRPPVFVRLSFINAYCMPNTARLENPVICRLWEWLSGGSLSGNRPTRQPVQFCDRFMARRAKAF
jgi:hypothetical protein